jgi:flagellar hook-length control protein FliK
LNDIGTPPPVQLPTSSPIPEDIPFQVGPPASPGFSSLKQVTSSLSSSEDNISPESGPVRHIEIRVVDAKGTHFNAMDMEGNNGLLNRDSKGLERILFDSQGLLSRSEGQGGHPSEVTNILNDPKGGFDVTPGVSEELPKAVEPTHSRAEPLQIYEQIGKKIIWTLKNNEERIRLTLQPPQLGNIYMEITKGEGNIRATLWTDNPVTKEILEMNQGQLHRILKEDGFKLEKFEVFTQQDMESFRERGESLYDHRPWANNGFKEHKASSFIEPVEITPTEMNLSHRGNNSIDVFV